MGSSPHQRRKLNKSLIASIIYHDIFDYPLTFDELNKWKLITKKINGKRQVANDGKYYYLKGRESLVEKRISREKYFQRKLAIANEAATWFYRIPTIRMVAVTGSLAMNNTRLGSDIDLMIITRKGTLWTTRLITYFLLLMTGFKLRRAGEGWEKDKLCLNIWMDESNLKFKIQNSEFRYMFVAHELSQIIPLVNKSRTYEKLLTKNKWVVDYWPKATAIRNNKQLLQSNNTNNYDFIFSLFESFAFWLQKQYMRKKITNEVITSTRAFFHPVDWSEKVKKELDKRGL